MVEIIGHVQAYAYGLTIKTNQYATISISVVGVSR